jgi:plastocyanin
MKRFGLFCAAMCLVAAFATACGGSGTSTPEKETGTATATASPTGTAEATSGPAAASAATITIASMNYGEPITVPPGAQITIKNDDSAEHSVTSDTADKFSVDVDGKEQGTLTAPTEPGDYAFHCKYHPSMHGTLTVK